ncbi:MAG: right-handed parallel beta-helix repeat-containing protein [Candidatus Bathyarchaeota archaeon]|nr:right-handed parallel beta-helix repeat-containing protein [Candidatus Bathyarchaeota archaeon]
MKFVVVVFVVILLVSSVFGASVVFSTFTSSPTPKNQVYDIAVPDDYSTITEAIGNATIGDTVLVRAGTYSETQFILDKPLTLISEEGATVQVIITTPMVTVYNLYIPEVVPDLGIKIESSNVELSGFTISSTGGISAIGDHIKISDNIFSFDSGAVNLEGSYFTLSKNTIPTSVEIVGSYQTISDNTISGELTCTGSFCTIARNNLGREQGQIITLKGSTNIIEENTFYCIYLQDSSSNNIINNVCTTIWLGIYSSVDCSNNTITGNLMQGPGPSGIIMGKGENNVFYHNYITDFNRYGIVIGGTELIAQNNLFYYNVLTSNHKNYRLNWDVIQSVNSWDNGQVGNYWSDYTGTDGNGDGVGDTPYIIKSNRDNYPLITMPFDINHVKV